MSFYQAVPLSVVRDRLEAEAAKLDAVHGGIHRFNNIRLFAGRDEINWTANFGVKGRKIAFGDSVHLEEMRKALAQTQPEFPIIDFAT